MEAGAPGAGDSTVARANCVGDTGSDQALQDRCDDVAAEVVMAIEHFSQHRQRRMRCTFLDQIGVLLAKIAELTSDMPSQLGKAIVSRCDPLGKVCPILHQLHADGRVPVTGNTGPIGHDREPVGAQLQDDGHSRVGCRH